jgi:succinate-semialdehyde dehydrogenase/glutarate-semialdehyde dehydrogenase
MSLVREWVNCKEYKTDVSTDPATAKIIGTQPEMDRADTEAAIVAAAAAFPEWRKTTGRQRSKLLRKWYDLVIENADDLAKLITWENGKPIADAKGEIRYAASFLEWFAEEAPRAYGTTIPASNTGNRIFTVNEPIGVCGLITP